MVELRMRIGRALRALPTALTIALTLAGVTLAVRKTFPAHLSDARARQILIGAAAIVVLAIVISLLRRLSPSAGSIALDRHHDLHDRLTNALAFEALKPEQRTALMEVAIDDACEHAGKLKPGKAAPMRLPLDLLGSLAEAVGVVGIVLLYVPAPVEAPPQLKTIDALTMSPDDVELFRDAAKQFDRQDQSPEMKAAVERFNQLIEDIANKRLDRTEAFRKMEAIERELLKGAEADAKSMEEALKAMAEELKKNDLAKPIGESLDKKDLDKAKKDLKALAEQLKDSKKKPDKAALDRLQKALAKAAARQKEALAAINEKRNETREQLLAKKNQKHDDPDGGPKKDPEEEKLLKKKERELERLDREAERQERVGRQLERLDRELAKAAEDLMKELGDAAKDLEQAAEDINRLQEEQMSDKEKEELRQRLEELRELLRQQGQGGKQRMVRMMKFGKRARGGSGQKGEKGEKGEDGQQGQDGQDGEDGQDGQDGKDGKDGQGKQPGGKGQLVIGPGGKKILIPGGSGGMPGGDGPGDSPGGQNGNGPDSPGGGPGKGAGTSHDGNLAGKRTDLKGGTVDVQEQGLDTQQGPSNSEIILSAAERGFKGTGYKKVFTKYHTVAEQQINKDQVPDGYRFYVHRYFQLIRPRD
ncbi:MAG: hypothetical protein ABI193_00550 [Minicystis sp.]